MKRHAEKFGFRLKQKENWPPFDVEHIWLEEKDGKHIVRSIPFFLKGICLDDELSISADSDNYVSKYLVRRRSRNSTVWIISKKPGRLLAALEHLGCIVEGEPLKGYFAINLPAGISLKEFDEALSSHKKIAAPEVAYATLRHSTKR